jgi:hypothetical protein
VSLVEQQYYKKHQINYKIVRRRVLVGGYFQQNLMANNDSALFYSALLYSALSNRFLKIESNPQTTAQNFLKTPSKLNKHILRTTFLKPQKKYGKKARTSFE